MSDPQGLPPIRHPVLTPLMILAGAILLLPGLCSALFMGTLIYEEPMGLFREPGFVLLWLVCFAIAWGGILLIRRAIRGRPQSPTL
jgi:hypothetical protein